MARDYEDARNANDLGDRELAELVREQLAATNAIDADDVTVQAFADTIRIEGRVGTEEERNVIDHILSDLIGLDTFENNVVVDPIRRAESPEAIDDHLADDDVHEGILLGDRPRPLSPEAEHLAEDLDAQLYGTTDLQEVMEEGATWIPPEGPTPEGHGEEIGG
jgi:hypothetical protein